MWFMDQGAGFTLTCDCYKLPTQDYTTVAVICHQTGRPSPWCASPVQPA